MDKSLFLKIEKLIETIDNTKTILEIPNVKKLSGYKNYYRIRLGSYRLGFEKINDQTFRFIVVSLRKDIYKIFP